MTQATAAAAATLPLARWSIDDYHQMIASGILSDRRVELLEGIIVEMSPVEPIHEGSGDAAADHLRERLGRPILVREGKAITLPNASEPQPDIAVVERRDYTDHHPYPDNIYLLLEIANSSLAADLDIKRPLYARAGIQEYWVMDVASQTLHMFKSITGEGDASNYATETVIPLNQEDTTIYLQAFPSIGLSTRALKRLER